MVPVPATMANVPLKAAGVQLVTMTVLPATAWGPKLPAVVSVTKFVASIAVMPVALVVTAVTVGVGLGGVGGVPEPIDVAAAVPPVPSVNVTVPLPLVHPAGVPTQLTTTVVGATVAGGVPPVPTLVGRNVTTTSLSCWL